MPKAQPKVLRVGIIQGGKVIEERLLRRREPVTIGQTPKNTFHVPIPTLPKSKVVFDVRDDRYVLCFDEDVQGRVSLGDNKVVPLAALKSHPGVDRRGGVNELPISDRSRGKIVIGQVTLLFQFVAAPPVVPKPQLPASAKGGLLQAMRGESSFIGTILVSVVLQLGLVLFSVFTYEGEEEEDKARRSYTFVALNPDVVKREKVEPEKEDEDEDEDKKEDDTLLAKKKEEQPKAAPKPEVAPKKPLKATAKRAKRAERSTARNDGARGKDAARRNRLKKIRKHTIIKHLTSAAPGGTAGPDSLARGHARRYAEAFKSVGPVKAGKLGEIAGFDGGPRAPGGPGSAKTHVAGLTKVERGGTKLRTDGAVKVVAAKDREVKVKVNVGLRGGRKSGGLGKLDGSVVTRVFQRRSSAFRRCYENRLRVRPNIQGKIVIRFTIGSAGRITRITVASNSTGDSAVGSCIVDKVRGMRFSPPENGEVTFTYPIVLSKG